MEQSRILKDEADKLLKQLGIMGILNNYGHAEFTGSYLYNLMSWADIDICLTVDELNPEKIFEIGNKLVNLPDIATMYFRNELILKTEGNPKAIFWCLEFTSDQFKIWKIDILIATHEVTSEVLKPGKILLSKLTDDKRTVLLSLKSHLTKDQGYRKEFRSVDIYKAVIDDDVISLEQWNEWLKRKKG